MALSLDGDACQWRTCWTERLFDLTRDVQVRCIYDLGGRKFTTSAYAVLFWLFSYHGALVNIGGVVLLSVLLLLMAAENPSEGRERIVRIKSTRRMY